MRFAEELLLLLLNEDAGTVAVPEANLGFALAGARLMDLAIEGRIDTDLAQLVAVDSTPLGDDLLDPVLTAVAAETTVRGAEFWVRRLAAEADGIEDAVLARLLDAGILEMDESGMHLSPQPDPSSPAWTRPPSRRRSRCMKRSSARSWRNACAPKRMRCSLAAKRRRRMPLAGWTRCTG